MSNELTVNEFIELTRMEPSKWINYCEVLITKIGTIILARPSHQEAIIQYAAEVEDKSVNQIKDFLRKNLLSPLDYYVDKYNIISVWYDSMLVPVGKKSGKMINKFQKMALDRLTRVGLIDITFSSIADEYHKYLYRESLSKEVD